MLELLVTNEESLEVLVIKAFLNFVDLKVEIKFDPDEVHFLNQGTNDSLLMKDEMIIARGFYEIVNFIKVEGTIIYD